MRKNIMRKILSMILVLGLVLQTGMPVLAEEEKSSLNNTPKVLFEDDFESGELDSRWKENEKGEYVIQRQGENHVLNMRGYPWDAGLTVNEGKADWRDYSVEMEFTINDWIGADEGMAQYDCIGLAGKIQNNNRIALYYRRASKKLELNKFYSNAGHSVAEAEYEILEGMTYKMKLEFNGKYVLGYIAPREEEYTEPILQWTDDGNKGSALEYGGCGIENGGCDVLIDNFSVVGNEGAVPIEKLEIKETNVALEKGKQIPLTLEVEPKEAAEEVIWESSDKNVATVDKNGVVTGVAEGTAVITVTVASDTTKKDQCNIEIYESSACETFYYVSPEGSDDNDGSKNEPFATIEKARDTIRELDGDIPDGGITVYLREGEYYQNETIEFTPEDSGKAGKPIVYTSYPGEKAIITGGKEIKGWEKLEGEVPYMSDEAKGNLYVADIEKGWRFHDLYVDGERQQISQQMETKQFRTWPQFSGAIGEPDSRFLELDPKKGIKVRFNEGELDGLANNPDIEINCMTVMFWNSLPILKDVDEEDNTAWLYSYNPTNLGDDFNSFNTKEGGWYSIQNDIKYLDIPGEWVVDSVNGKVYYWPKEKNFAEKKIVAPKPYELIRFQGDGEEEKWEKQVQNIFLDNLTIEYADRISEDHFDQFDIIRNSENPDGMIVFDGAKTCKVTNCEIKHCGAYGVTLRHYAQENEITGNQIEDMGSGGVNLSGYGPGIVDLNKDNRIMYNVIRKLGRAPYYHTAGVSVYQSGNNIISYNYISESPYAGVTIVGEVAVGFNTDKFSASWDFFGDMNRQYGFRWEELEPSHDYSREEVKQFLHSRNNTVEYNIIDEYMTGVEDGGGLYAWGCGNGNKYANNIIIKTEEGMHWTFPLYMDDGVDEFTISGNRIWSMEQDTVNKGENQWSDNEFSWPNKPDGYDELKTHILNTVEEETGKALFPKPEAVELQYPKNGENGMIPPFQMSWNAVENVARYKVEIASDPEFNEIVFSQMTENTSIQGPDLEWGQTYCWRVASCVMAEPLIYSQTGSFSMADGDSVITVKGEEYTDQEGTQIEEKENDKWLAYIEDGDWMEYQVNIPKAGEYRLNYKVSVNKPLGKVEFVVDDKVLADTELPGTGGWQNWTRVSDTVEFKEAGNYTIRLNVVTGGWNLDKFELIRMESVPVADKSLLQSAYDYALTLRTDGVTEAAKEVFEKAKAEAKAVLDDPNATQEKIDEVWWNLVEAIHGLGVTQGDTAMLELLVEKANQMVEEKDKYVDTNWKQLEEALKQANDILADESENITPDMVEEAVNALHEAILVQRYKANKDNLQEIIDKAEGFDLSNYTKESVAVFQKALEKAKNVMKDDSLSEDDQAEVDQAEKELKNAINGLKLVSNDGNGNNDGNNNANFGNNNNNGVSGDKNAGKDSPKTGDMTQSGWLIAVLFLSLGTMVVVKKRKLRR